MTAEEVDNDTQGLTVTPTDIDVNEGGTNTFSVVLDAQPLSDVTVTVSRTAGDADLSVSAGGTLTFTPSNWDTPQDVTVAAAEDDDAADGTATLTVSSAGLTSVDVTANEVDNDTQGLTVTPTDIDVNEGGTNTFSVVLDAQPLADVTVTVSRTAGDADLSVSAGGTLTFTPSNWDTPQDVTVAAAEDDDAADGTATLTVSSAGLTSVDVTADEVDNDTQGLTVTPTNIDVNEGGTNTFSVVLDAQPLADVTVTVSRTAGDADLSVSAGGTLTFTPSNWDTPQDVTVAAAEDDDAADGTATLTVSSAGLTSVDVTADEIDNDTQGLTVTPTDIDVNEGGTNTFSVVLDAQPLSDVTVTVSHTAGDADLSVSEGGTLTFTPSNWDTPQDVTIAAAEDGDFDDGSAVFTVSSAGLPDKNVTVGELDDDIMPTVTLSVDNPSILEDSSNPGMAAITATLNAVSEIDVTVDLSVSGTATSGVDYILSTVQILVPAGSMSASATVSVLDDALDEFDETVIADIVSVTNGLEDGMQQVLTTIIDDDALPLVSLAVDQTSVPENATGIATVTATLSAASGRTVTINLGLEGSATIDVDYTGPLVPQIVIPAGQLTGFITGVAIEDTLNEADETVVVGIASVVNGVEDGVQEVTTTITDDDPLPVVSLSIDTPSIAEGPAGVATITATLDTVSGRDVVVNLTAGGTAAAGVDYTLSTAQITIPAGQLSATAAVTGIADTVDEFNETVIVDIDTVVAGVEDGVQQVAIAITDDDPGPDVLLTVDTPSVTENAADVATVTASLSEESGKDVTVQLAVNGSGTATDGIDFTMPVREIVIPAGSLSGTVSIVPVSDVRDEADETVIVDINNVINGVESSPQQVTVLIQDDDPVPSVSLSADITALPENPQTVATVTVSLGEISANDVTANLFVRPASTAVAGSDFTFAAQQVVVPAGSISATTTIVSLDDSLGEGDESVILAFASVINGDSAGAQDLTLTIVDDDGPYLVVSETMVGVSEGGSNTFNVRLGAQPAGDVVVNVSRTSGDADLNVTSGGMLTFTPTNWNTPQDVTVAAAEDDDAADGSATLTVASAGMASVGVTANEVDSDTQGLTVTPLDLDVDEGGTDTFSVVLDAQPLADVTVSVSRTGGDSDLSVSSGGTLTFTPANWDTPQDVTVSAAEDADAADGVATLTVSSAGLTSVDVTANEEDNDTQGLTVTPVDIDVNEGDTSTFSVVLDAQPLADLTVTVSRTAGDADLSVSAGGTLTFTPANWNTPQDVTVSAAEDADAADGSATLTVSTAGLTSVDVTADEVDNDTQGLTVTPTDVDVDEGGTSTFSVVLDAQPLADVTVTVSRTAGDSDLSVSTGGTLTFTSANWDTPQDVTVAAAEDEDAVDGTATLTVSSSGLASVDVTTNEVDNDTAGLTVTPLDIDVDEGGSNTFSVVLDSQPLMDVTLTVSRTSGDADLSVSSGSTLTFSPVNWDQAQTVTLSAVDDGVIDGDIASVVTVSVNDAASDDTYDNVADVTVNVTSIDARVPVTAVRIRLTDTDYLQLDEVQVLETMTGTNIAPTGTASQSSTYDQNSGADRANDGIADVGYPVSGAITDLEFGAWWRVDFGRAIDPAQVIIHNRGAGGSRLEGAVVEALDANGTVVWFSTVTGAADGSIHSFDVVITPDTTAPTADLADPSDGDTVLQSALNDAGYIDVNFADMGGSGLNTSTIDGNELMLSGDGVGSAMLTGMPALVSGTTYRYPFTGSFAAGTVNVNLVAGSWEDNAGNSNEAETENFTVQVGRVGFVRAVRIRLTDADYLQLDEVLVLEAVTGTNVALTGTASQSSTYDQNSGADRANDGNADIGYPVSGAITDLEFGAWWRVDLARAVDPAQIIIHNRGAGGSRLEDAVVEALDADGNVLWARTVTGAADGSVHTFDVTIPPDTTAPTADLAGPTNGDTIIQSTLNGRGYIDVNFADIGGSGVNTSTIDGNELMLSGDGVGSAMLTGTATLVSGKTYRYPFTGSFAAGTVNVNFVAGTWQDNAGNNNEAETESFTVQADIVTAVRIRLTDTDYLQLDEVQVLEAETGTNLALAGTASQSSTYDSNAVASKANDGNTDAGYPVSGAITNLEFGASWRVDFGRAVNPAQIIIHNRGVAGSRLEDAVVEALDQHGNVVWSRTVTGTSDGSIHTFDVVIAGGMPGPIMEMMSAQVQDDNDAEDLFAQVATDSESSRDASADDNISGNAGAFVSESFRDWIDAI